MTNEARPLIPLYAAAFIVLFCGISAVNSTVENPQTTFFTTLLVAVGVCTSFWVRAQKTDQRILVWIASGLAAVLFLMQPFFTEISRGFWAGAEQEGFSSSTIGVVLEWATVLFSFTLLTNYSLLFSVVPSMALIGLMSSENLNPEMVTYFLGFVLSTVFLMGYQSYLERVAADGESEDRVAANLPPTSYRPYIILSAAVVAGAFAIGHVASAPLKFVGRQVFSVAANNLPTATSTLFPLDLQGAEDSMSLSGLPPDLTTAEVMRVKSRVPQYWRGGIYEKYNGNSWNTDFSPLDIESSNRREDPSSLNVFRLDRNDLVKQLKSREILNYSVATSKFISAIYMAGEPRRIEGPMERVRATGQLTARSDAQPNQLAYHVTSLVTNATPDQLRQAPSWREVENGGDAASHGAMIYPSTLVRTDMRFFQPYEELFDTYVRLPRSVPRGLLRKQAERITQGKTTDYDRALAIEQFLKSHYIYTLEPPTLPPGKDAAEFFLFESRSGYCEQFANAMAVMLRTLRIPARIAVGYAPGEYDSARGEWVVRELDAHAWVEVFFPTYGWIPFDPTGGIQPEPPGFSFRKVWAAITRFIGSREFLPSIVFLVIVGVFGYAVKSEAYDRYLRAHVNDARRRWQRRGVADSRWAVERNYRRLRKLLRKRGVTFSPSQTPNEVREIALKRFGEGSELSRPVSEITDLYVRAAYSDLEMQPGSDRASEEWLEQVRQGLKTHGRR
jgi:hypothetical protein